MSKLVFKGASKGVDVSEVIAVLLANPTVAGDVLRGLKDGGITTPKKEKEVVAYRIQTKDTPATAKKQRKAGEKFPLSEQALSLTLQTWIKGTDASTKIDEANGILNNGGEVEFASFKLVGIA